MIIAIIIFVTLFSTLFGMENTLFGVGVITAVLMCVVINLGIPIKDSCIVILTSLLIMSFSTYLSVLNPLGGVVINFITVFFIILFDFLIPENFNSYVLLFLSYIYTFIKEYKVQIVFITMNSLGAATLLNDISVLAPMRINFVLAGTVIAFVVNKGFYNKQSAVQAQG